MAGGIGNYALFTGGPFQIATLVPDVTIEAVGLDALAITAYPCEDGAVRSDHSVKLPVRLEMVAGWSDSTAGFSGYIQQIYSRLLALQATRQPFTISTSRRLYRNMLLESLTDPISSRTYNAMVPRITFRELQISRTQTSNANTVQPATNPANQSDPANTGAVTDRGTVTGTDVSPQAFAGAFNPGSYTVDGTRAVGQDFITSGLNIPGPDLTINQITAMPGSGFSAQAITVPDLSVASLPEVGGLQVSGPNYYNVFGGSP
ncbi:phage baseplate protein [Methylobacterium sp. J-076]|uniref:phage baseplate protein n=1 Tax=Methylobacterium sp. J-076 TaxID=2836655 RepID=UPI001FBB1EF0|nr:hypothetical protein [Methylobacterium sp. J-076]MCJ2012668.1 hypothetical protein [Methylobacterium sp. J-076]